MRIMKNFMTNDKCGENMNKFKMTQKNCNGEETCCEMVEPEERRKLSKLIQKKLWKAAAGPKKKKNQIERN